MDNKYIADNSGGGFGYGFGGGGIAVLFLFLIILFAVFRRGGFDGGEGGHWGGHGGGFPFGGCMSAADFEAWPQNFQRIPKAELLSAQQTSALKEAITNGDWALSKQIQENKYEARVGELCEQLSEQRQRNASLENMLSMTKIEKCIEQSAAATNARIGHIECQMLKKPEVEALAGIHPAGIVNFPIPTPFYPLERDRDRDRGCNCRPCFNV